MNDLRPAKSNPMPTIWRGLDDVPADLGQAVVTIGVFDGVHLGHQVILERAAQRARSLGQPSVVITFDPHPSEVVRPGSQPAMLTSIGYRAELLTEAGADAVLVLRFDTALSHLTPAEFVDTVLVGKLHASAVVVGANFRF